MNTFELTLDLDKSVGAKQWVTLRQGDKCGTTLRATLYDHGVLVSGSYTCRVSIRHPNRNTYYRETATYLNGVATVTIDETSAASVVGVTEGYFELLQGSTLIASTESFGVRVLQSATDGATVGPPYDSAIRDALDELDAATGRISQMVVDATAEYLAAHPEITTTVQDNSVTDAKLIQSGGVLDRVGRLWWRLENLLTATPAEAESVTVSDAAKTPVAGLTVFGKSTQDGTPTPDAPVPIQSVEPNILKNTVSTTTVNGVNFTVNDDGTVTANGTATANAQLRIDMFVPSDGTYTISGCPANGSSSTYAIRAYTNNGVTFAAQDVGEGATFDFVASTHVNLSVYIFVFRNATVNNLTFGPMVARGTKDIRGFVPYNGIGLYAVGKNLFDSIRTGSRTNQGITWTYNADGTITANGTASSSSWSHDANTRIPMELAAGTYTASVPSPLGLVVLNSTDGSYIYNGSDSTKTFTLTKATTVNVYARVASGATVANLTFGIQLEIGSTATPYQPYQSVTIPIDLDGHTLRSLPDGTRDEVTVDERGHAVLTQRVGEFTLDGTSAPPWVSASRTYTRFGITFVRTDACNPLADTMTFGNISEMLDTPNIVTCAAERVYFSAPSGVTTAAQATAFLAEHPMTLLYKLKTPQTIDLGYVAAVPLVGPDLTAQAIPTAPFALTYERDLNTTLARLEAALATLA